MDTLHPEGMPPTTTRLRRGTFGGAGARQEELTQRMRAERGIIRAAPQSFTYLANTPPLTLAVFNQRRVGLLLQNRDPTNAMFYNFGAEASAVTASMAVGGYVLLDFICPCDAVSITFATNNGSGYFCEFFRT